MSHPTSERQDRDRGEREGRQDRDGQVFRRKIDCAESDSARGDERRASGRGGGLSDPEQWRRESRDARG